MAGNYSLCGTSGRTGFKEFKLIDDLMTSVFYLHKRSGKLKRMFRNTANALNIDGYVFPKVTGTRFVTHRLKGTKILLHNWTALADSFRTAISDRKAQPIAILCRKGE